MLLKSKNPRTVKVLLYIAIASAATSCFEDKDDDHPDTSTACDYAQEPVASKDARKDQSYLELLDLLNSEKSYELIVPTKEEWKIEKGKLLLADREYNLQYWDADFSWVVVDETMTAVGSLRAFVAPDCGQYRYFQLEMKEGSRTGRLKLQFNSE